MERKRPSGWKDAGYQPFPSKKLQHRGCQKGAGLANSNLESKGFQVGKLFRLNARAGSGKWGPQLCSPKCV
eukprot:1160727-Pelagomonas_calceolata.AAC.15